MNSIVWLASYPKSGNTWLRVFLTNYVNFSQKPADINLLVGNQICTDRELFNEVMGVDSSELTIEAIAKLRPLFHKQLAAECSRPYFIKTHDAYSFNGLPLFPEQATLGVIYLVRNPLDLVASYAHHENVSIDVVIRRMETETQLVSFSKTCTYEQLPQLLHSWTGHLKSWLYESKLPTLLVPYEDMHTQPYVTFRKVVEFCGLEIDEYRLRQAIELSRFNELQEQERRKGLAMKQPTAKTFFRYGSMGRWKNELSCSQASSIINEHALMMKKMGYL